MPDIDASIPLRAQAPNTFTSLKDMLSIASGAQALQTGAIEQRRQAVVTKQAEGTMTAREAIKGVMADPQYRDPETGLLDLNKVAPAMQAADPMNYVWQDALQKTAQVNGDMMKLKSAAMTLSDQQQAYVGQRVGAVIADPNATREDLDTTLGDVLKTVPSAKPQVDIIRSHVNGLDAETANKWRQVATTFRNQAFPLADQKPATGFVNNGPQNIPVQSNPLAGPVGPMAGATPVPNQVPPTAAEQTGTDINGNPVRIVRDLQGRISLQPMNTGGGAPGGAQTPPMYSFPAGESPQTKAALEGERQSALTSLSQAPVLHATNRGVLEEIDKTIATGAPGPTIQHIASTLGAAFGTPEQKASAYDLVGKYLERNALQAAQAMGPHTNAGLESAIKSNGSVSYNPTAIKKITKLNDAIVSGVEAYQPGLELAIQSSPNQIFAKRQFDQQWAQNFDPMVMQLFNAKKGGDQREVADLTRSLTSQQRHELARKAQAIEMLSTQGHL